MPVIEEAKAGEMVCPFLPPINQPWAPMPIEARCRGARCMAWVWHGQAFAWTNTNGITPDQEPPVPEGEGWEKNGAEQMTTVALGGSSSRVRVPFQRWQRKMPMSRGFCGRVEARMEDTDTQIPF